MSSYDKVVKLACKPKAAPPKTKYLEPIIAATWLEDGAVHDVCKALSLRFKEPNAIVVFKALIVLHTMIRNGATDNVLAYLSSTEVLRLRNVSASNWEGYVAPENLQNYAIYLDCRIRAYHELKHDAIRVQSETNRDLRNSQSIEVDFGVQSASKSSRRNKSQAPPPSKPLPRSKTISGRKLRIMTVEKGLLRETKVVHKMIDALIQCRFYLNDIEDELITTALRMLVKDLLILFQAGNEGVINLLEHYFEMSHVDAVEALKIYRNFCKQTELVVEYLAVARKMENILNVSIPNLRYAPVSLAGALQEYLDDPNFEQNRIEYKTNRDAAESQPRNGSCHSASSASPSSPPAPSSSTSGPKAVTDFFSAIEEQQAPAVNQQQALGANPMLMPPQGVVNPFMQMQQTGQFQLLPQATGAFAFQQQLQPQHTAMPFSTANPMPVSNPSAATSLATTLRHPPGAAPALGHRPFTTFIPQQPQTTGFVPQSFSMGSLQSNVQALQPQMTGANPFRPQTTGMAISGGGSTAGPAPGLSQSPPGAQQQQQQPQPAVMSAPAWASVASSPFSNPLFGLQTQSADLPTRPMSTPLTAFGTASTTNGLVSPQPVQTHLTGVRSHTTGTKNPFGPVVAPPPPVPKVPTLMELVMGRQQQAQQQQQQLQTQPTGLSGQAGQQQSNLSLNSDMSGIASTFSFNNSAPSRPNGTAGDKPASASQGAFSALSLPGSTSSNSSTSGTAGASSSNFSALFSQPTGFASGLSSQPTGFSPSLTSQPTGFTSSVASQPTGASLFSSSTLSSATSSTPSTTLKPHLTGYSAGIKPFKPSSSFGASLMESLPPIPGSAPSTPDPSASQQNSTSNPVTGGGAANPFRVSAAPLSMGSGFTGQGGFGGAPAPNSTSFQSPSTFGAVGGSSTGFSGSSMFNGGFGADAFGSFAGGTAGQTSAFGGLGQQTPQSTTVPGTASLI
ncbi:ANTH-domain-containing protein [Fistulina hepatica ATCC 64428]|uniref:ANTH-domain-containing protein n=1 Tax=Fistulina hepatica ATCC 64428 TaxID=1128425 RepID=A0A0D6ZZZ6_9AGAR|nr:ANTH-domain-containing protein [Fistulina hepatica ATCC 64428]